MNDETRISKSGKLRVYKVHPTRKAQANLNRERRGAAGRAGIEPECCRRHQTGRQGLLGPEGIGPKSVDAVSSSFGYSSFVLASASSKTSVN